MTDRQTDNTTYMGVYMRVTRGDEMWRDTGDFVACCHFHYQNHLKGAFFRPLVGGKAKAVLERQKLIFKKAKKEY